VLPPLTQQTALVRGLDDMDRRLPCDILAKQTLIKRLAEHL